jgi:outer membrane lipoprotein-sorting protein
VKKLSIFFNLCLIILSVFIILFTANIKKTYASENNAIIKKIELKYSSINSITANFIQKEILRGYSQSITSKGSFFYKRPDGLAWIYTLPYKQKEVYINKRLYIINGKLKQVLVYNMNNNASGGFPPNVISLLGEIRKYFKIINIKQNYKTNSIQIEMKPLKSQLAKLIYINFEKNGYNINSILIVTAQGRMETYYSNEKFNGSIKNSIFSNKFPSSYKIINEKE